MTVATKPAVKKPARRKPAVDQVEAALNEMLAKPAKRVRKPAVEPANERPAARKKPAARNAPPSGTITVGVLADHLGVDNKTLRARIRRHFGGAQVGKGGRYGWNSMKDPQVKEIVALFKK